MSFIRRIKKKSGVYLAEVESYRDGKRVRQRLIRYLGKEGSLQARVTTPSLKPVSTTVDFQIALQRRSAANNMTPEKYLEKMFDSHHGVSRKTGKRY